MPPPMPHVYCPCCMDSWHPKSGKPKPRPMGNPMAWVRTRKGPESGGGGGLVIYNLACRTKGCGWCEVYKTPEELR